MSAGSLCSPRVIWLGLIGLAVLLRVGVMLQGPERLTEDRDLYLGIANEMRAGHGFATPGSQPPRATAFRPPLYPTLLLMTRGQALGIGALHLLLAGGMVVATGMAAKRFAGGGDLAHWGPGITAAGIVAIDPLLVLYSGQPMTETLCSCLSAGLLWAMSAGTAESESPLSSCRSLRRPLVTGAIWGLCLLARPTYAAAFAIWVSGGLFIPGACTRRWSDRLRDGCMTVIVAVAILSPWVIRNWWIFGQPIATTTHGGYTLWLANNPVYYSEVVEGDDTAWNGDSLNRWQTETNQEMDSQLIQGEVAQDRWQGNKARRFIRENPGRFVRACAYRATRFWSIWPGRPGEAGLPRGVLWGVAGGYAALWLAATVAIGRALIHSRWQMLRAAGSLTLGFFLVHLVYWTDARMRAPIMPAIAVLVAVGLSRPAHSTPSSIVQANAKPPSA